MPWIILLIIVKAEKRLHFKNNNLKSVRFIIYFIIFLLFLRAFFRMMYDAMCGCFKSHNHIRLTVGIKNDLEMRNMFLSGFYGKAYTAEKEWQNSTV